MRSRREALKNQRIVLGSIWFLCMITFVIVGFVLFGTIKTQAAPADTLYKYYTSIQIQRGDTLWNIANTHITQEYADVNDYIEEICMINNITAEDIHSGQYLTLPYYSSEYLE